MNLNQIYFSAALNFQETDIPIQLNKALFADNGNSGFVLKPEILRNPSLGFDPTDTNTMKNKKKFKIKVISAQDLPFGKNNLTTDISDPYVKVNIYGVPADYKTQKTETIENNGFNPIWNQEFEFGINCPELAFVQFSVIDENLIQNKEIGNFSIRFENILSGKP